jgi:hypothetical protein
LRNLDAQDYGVKNRKKEFLQNKSQDSGSQVGPNLEDLEDNAVAHLINLER